MIKATVTLARAVAGVLAERAKASTLFARAVADTAFDRAIYSVLFDRAKVSAIEFGLFIRQSVYFLAEFLGLIDRSSIDVSKRLQEQSAISEDYRFDLSAMQSDSGILSEDKYLDVAKLFQDQLSMSDGERRAVEKALQDSPAATDTKAFAIVKALSDVAYATDDVFGEANADDDQNITFLKVISELLFSTESIKITMDFIRYLADSGLISESSIVNVGKHLQDEGLIDDAQLFAIASSKSDTAVVLDNKAASLSTARSDAFSVAESIAISSQFIRSLSDNGLALEDLSVSIDKVFGDSIGLVDVILIVRVIPILLSDNAYLSEFNVKDAIKSISDASLLSEQIAKNIINTLSNSYVAADSASLLYQTAFDNNGSITDADIKSQNKALTNASIFADTGSLRSQGYCDFSYFAEDYVGESRTFT